MDRPPWRDAGNVARDAAHAAGHAVIDIAERDVDVPLSRLGEQQSRALGHWFAAQPEQPDVILTSPYLRARRTAMLIADVGGAGSAAEHFTIDERLREKEFGVLDRLFGWASNSNILNRWSFGKHLVNFITGRLGVRAGVM